MSRNFEILQKANKEQKIFASSFTGGDVPKASLLEVDKETVLDQTAQSQSVLTQNSQPPEFHPLAQSSSNPAHAEAVKYPLPGTLEHQHSRRERHFKLSALTRWAAPSHPRKQILTDRIPDVNSAILNEEIKLAQHVFLAERSNAPHLVLFCAVDSGNGCTSVCAGAGKALAAQVSGEVCIVDANLRTPALHRHFALDNDRGFAETASQPDSLGAYIHVLPGSNLSVLTSGQMPRDPYALLGPANLKPLLAELRSRFDYVLIDSPPVSSYSDATFLAQLVDGVVLIIEADATHMEAARKAKERLDAANLKQLAAVLTKRTFPIPEVLCRKLW